MAYNKRYFKNNKLKYIQKVIDNVKKDKMNEQIKNMENLNFLEIFYGNVKGALPKIITDMFTSKKISLEILKEGKANAFVEKIDDKYKICMTQNLDDLLYWSCRIYSLYPDNMPIEEVTSRFLDCLWMLEITGQLKPYCLSDKYGNSYDPSISIGAGMFFFLHEIGHLMIELNGDAVEDSIHNELLADTYALKMFLGEYSDFSYPKEIVYKYILFSLYTVYAKDVLEDNEALDHPIVEVRIENINKLILEKYPDFLDKLHKIKDPIKNFYSRIANMVETETYARRQLNIVQDKNERFAKIHRIIDNAASNRLVPDYMEMISLTYSIYEDMEYFIMIPELIDLKNAAELNMQKIEELGSTLDQNRIEEFNNLFDRVKKVSNELMKLENGNERELLQQELKDAEDKMESYKLTDEEINITQEMDTVWRKTKLMFSYLDKIPEEYKEMIY